MAILVTGGKGFIGARVIRTLVESGEEVVCFDLKDSPGRLGELAGKVKMVAGDISTYADIYRAMADHGIDRIAHLVFFMAEERGVAARPEDSDGLYRQQMIMNTGTFHVFEAARQLGIRRMVFASSIQYHVGDEPWLEAEPVDENSPPRPTSSYGIGKFLCEHLAGEYNRHQKMEIVTIRIPGVYGPGVRIGARGVNLIGTEAALGRPTQLPYRPDQHIVLAHVDDIAHAVASILFAPTVKSQVYHIGGHYVSYGEIADLGRRITPGADICCTEDAPLRGQVRINSALAEKEIGLRHRSLEDGYGELAAETRRAAAGHDAPLSGHERD